MMLADTVAALHETADLLGEVGSRLTAVDPGAIAFGAGSLGLLGEVGREAHALWQGAIDARVREARDHEERMREFAVAVARAAGGFADAESDAGRVQHPADVDVAQPGAGVG